MSVDARAAVEHGDARLAGVGVVDASAPARSPRAAPRPWRCPRSRTARCRPGRRARAMLARAGDDVHALLAQDAQERLARLGLLSAQRRVAAQHHRDLDAEAVERLRELARDRSGSADGERGRQVVAAAPGRRSSGRWRPRCRRSARSTDARRPRARSARRAARSRRPRRRRLSAPPLKRAFPRTTQHAVLLQQPLVEPPAVLDHAVHAGHDRRAVDLDRRAHAELVTPPREVRDLRSPDQGLRRDAPDVDSGAAERLGLDHARRVRRAGGRAWRRRCRPCPRRPRRARARTSRAASRVASDELGGDARDRLVDQLAPAVLGVAAQDAFRSRRGTDRPS